MKIELTDEQLTGLVSVAILQAIDQGQRDVLIKEALQYLLSPKSDGYGRARSPLQEAFDLAVETTCRQMVLEMFREDANIRETLQALIIEGYHRALADREPLVNSIAESIARGFREHR